MGKNQMKIRVKLTDFPLLSIVELITIKIKNSRIHELSINKQHNFKNKTVLTQKHALITKLN
jgi:hypothetical protein